jgi:hypothetical protein
VAPARSALLVNVAAETSVAMDRSLWMGVGTGACVRVGRTCAGLDAHLARGADAGERPDGWQKLWQIDLLAAVAMPVALGRARLVPAVGIGAGRLTTDWLASGRTGGTDSHNRTDHGGHGGSDRRTDATPRDPMPAVSSAGPIRCVEHVLRGSAGVALSLPVFGRLSLELGLSFDSSFAAFDNDEASARMEQFPRHRLRAGLGFRLGRL